MEPDRPAGWKSYCVFRGLRPGVLRWSCHFTVQAPGARPHPPHSHEEEEVLLLLRGRVDVILPEAGAPKGERRVHLLPGRLSYYPAFFAHTVEAVGEEESLYLVLRWFNRRRAYAGSPITFQVHDLRFPDDTGCFASRLVRKGPTRYLKQLRCHTTIVPPHAAQDVHTDPYDVVLLILEGQVDALGEPAALYDVALFASGEPHGTVNHGEAAARLVAFEFHGLPEGVLGRVFYALKWRAARLLRRAIRSGGQR